MLTTRELVLAGVAVLVVGVLAQRSCTSNAKWAASVDSLKARADSLDAVRYIADVRHRTDSIVVQQMQRVVQRSRMVAGHVDTLYLRGTDSLRAALPDTLRPRLDSLTARHGAILVALYAGMRAQDSALALAQADAARYRGLTNQYASQRDEAIRFLGRAKPAGWMLGATVDQGVRVNVCGLRSLGRVLGVTLSAGVCYRT